jgi:hypothetical protein
MHVLEESVREYVYASIYVSTRGLKKEEIIYQSS